MESIAAGGPAAVRRAFRAPQFPLTKFGPPALPGTLVARPELHGQLAAGADRRLTVVVGSAGAGKTVLLADWTAARPPGLTSWLSCDGADGDLVRFWAGFIEAVHAIAPAFGTDAVDLLTMDGRMSADVIASLANDAARLPEGAAVIVDDFHFAVPAVARDMTDLVECWAAKNVQLVLASRFDPPLRLHRMRLAGELCEIRDRDMYFSLADTRHLLANFDVRLPDADLALLHQRSEGWPAALQMATLSLRSAADPAWTAQALEVRKDLAGELLAANVHADLYLMATDVDGVYLNWGTPQQRKLGEVTPDELAGHQFAAGSMGPKVKAAVRFTGKTGRRAAIGSLADIGAIVAGQAGTNVIRQKSGGG